MGEDYESSGDEAAQAVTSPPPEEAPAEEEPKGEGEEGGEEAAPETMEARQAKYKRQKALLAIEAQQSEEEFQELDIKVKIRTERKEAGDEKSKISTKLLCEAFRWRLSQNDCQNRGYVLDAFPFSYSTANQVFVITPDPPKQKEPEKDEDGNDIPVEEIPEEELAELMKPQF